MKKVDAGKLSQDLGYRFEYVSGFMGFGEEDVRAIHDAAAHLAPLVPTLVDAVYDRLFSYDITKAFFAQPQHGYEGETVAHEDELTLDHPQVAFRKQHLANYLVRLVTKPYDESMLKYLDAVGGMHTPNLGNAELVVPIVHVNALFGFVNSALIATLASLDIGAEDKVRMQSAFTKLLWIQNDLFSRNYGN
ncbi:MAG: protoglobin family protein [Planctomycetes bacterium]|nr:protoglobin family protein [Planctomycetota bacterium]